MTKRTTLANLLGARTQGAMVQSRIQDIAEMDALLSFFPGLERKSGKLIHSLLSDTVGADWPGADQEESSGVLYFTS